MVSLLFHSTNQTFTRSLRLFGVFVLGRAANTHMSDSDCLYFWTHNEEGLTYS